MPDQVKLTAERRTVMGKQVRHLRRQGKMPANLYGHNQESIPLTIDAHELETTLKHHGPSTLYQLSIRPDGVQRAALVRHIQRDAVTGAIEHIDFLHVTMDQPIKARIPLRMTGESPAVTVEKGVLLHQLDTLEIEARPADLPQFIEVDLSGLKELNSSLYVRDLTAPRGVTIHTAEDEAVVTVTAPRMAVPETTAAEEAAETPATGETPAATPGTSER